MAKTVRDTLEVGCAVSSAARVYAESSHISSKSDHKLEQSSVGKGAVALDRKDKAPKLGVTCKSIFKSGAVNRDEFNRLWANIINTKENYTACVEIPSERCYNEDMQSHTHLKDEVSGE